MVLLKQSSAPINKKHMVTGTWLATVMKCPKCFLSILCFWCGLSAVMKAHRTEDFHRNSSASLYCGTKSSRHNCVYVLVCCEKEKAYGDSS